MSVQSRVRAALDVAWSSQAAGAFKGGASSGAAEAIADVIDSGSPPARQMLFAILAGTAEAPTSNPASLQFGGGGVNRRTEAEKAGAAMASFKNEHGLTLKISREAGVSNPYREPEITQQWVDARRGKHRKWAGGLYGVVQWLNGASSENARSRRASTGLIDASRLLINWMLQSSYNYPRFSVTPRLAMLLVHEFLESAPDRPDAFESVVTVASRVLSHEVSPSLVVSRGDINSPDAIDIVIRDAADTISSGIEVTDDLITLAKLEHEVVDAMLRYGLDRATVFSRGVHPAEEQQIDEYLRRIYATLGQRIDLVTVDVIEAWLNFPGARADLSTAFVWGIGEELDQYSSDANRAAWYRALDAYTTDARSA